MSHLETGAILHQRRSALVTMRKQFPALTEMQILDYMIRSYVAGVSLSFVDAAALSAAFLAAGG